MMIGTTLTSTPMLLQQVVLTHRQPRSPITHISCFAASVVCHVWHLQQSATRLQCWVIHRNVNVTMHTAPMSLSCGVAVVQTAMSMTTVAALKVSFTSVWCHVPRLSMLPAWNVLLIFCSVFKVRFIIEVALAV